MNFGIIGYGKMGRLRHERMEMLQLGKAIAITDMFVPFDELGVGKLAVANAEDVIGNPQVEAVFIATANAHNKMLTIAALQAGKHVFCEKPPTLTAQEMREVMAVEKETKRTLMYGFNHRLHGAALKMREVVESGVFGRILWMRGRYGKSVDEDYLKTWRADRSLAGGGILIDQGIHMLDLFTYLGDSFNDVQAVVSSLYWKTPGIEDNVFAILRNSQTGQVASLHSTMTQWRHLFSLEVFMEQGHMVLNGLKTSSNTYGEEKLTIAKNRAQAPAAIWEEEENYVYETDESWDNELKIFVDSIRSSVTPPTGNSDHALAVMTLIDRIYQNAHHESDRLYTQLNATK